jgi:hypothetical protein
MLGIKGWMFGLTKKSILSIFLCDLKGDLTQGDKMYSF